MAKARSEKDKRYEDKHKAERKAKCMVWGTSVPREKAEHINDFLKRYGYTKVQLIEAGYKALLDDAAEHNLSLGKIMDGFFLSVAELFSPETENYRNRLREIEQEILEEYEKENRLQEQVKHLSSKWDWSK